MKSFTNGEKKIKLFRFIIMTIMFAALSWYVLFGSLYYCHKWGGKLYEDDHCYDISDLDRCILPNGVLTSKQEAIIWPIDVFLNNTGD